MVAEHSGENSHPGKLGLQFDWIADVDGDMIALSDVDHSVHVVSQTKDIVPAGFAK